MINGIVTDVQRFSIHDGPGIRTLIFLKGCPLGCPWCSNPETQSVENELMHNDFKCIDCGNCVGACPEHALKQPGKSFVDSERCTLCLACVVVCPTGALSLVGKEIGAVDVLALVEKDRLFYENSGGGVTFSGGEPFVQHQFLEETLALLKDENYHTAVETTGYAEWGVIDRLKGLIDLFLFDLKAYQGARHLALTGTGNARILDNLKRLSKTGAEIVIRVPVIPGLTDSNGNLDEIAKFVADCGRVKSVHLLPFHNMGKKKYGHLGKKYALGDTIPPSRERMEELKEIFVSHGLECMIGG
jgi:pyruvate formate lyase activating enzyme